MRDAAYRKRFDWIRARVEPSAAQWLMDIGVLHYANDGWVIDRDLWESRKTQADRNPKVGNTDAP